jgi:ribosome-associated toxin RatA of RatAB toxin-antitoxin module
MLERHEILVRAPRWRVYDILAWVDRWPAFMSALASVRTLARDRDALRVEMVESAAGVRDATRCHVTFRPGRGMRVRHGGGRLRTMEVAWRLRPCGDATRVVVHHRFALGWPLVGPLLDRLVIGPAILRPVVERSLANFKTLVETGRSAKRPPAGGPPRGALPACAGACDGKGRSACSARRMSWT